ncbi:uncharacterized protein RJT20DRAFT_43402 [Scheffersomyces xylosifermentans]|uniref:uncharacterized protein n=1 Tax=Scheffersomyces xylosifermentans TaxID=1304137 RepID=UPI00315D19D1
MSANDFEEFLLSNDFYSGPSNNNPKQHITNFRNSIQIKNSISSTSINKSLQSSNEKTSFMKNSPSMKALESILNDKSPTRKSHQPSIVEEDEEENVLPNVNTVDRDSTSPTKSFSNSNRTSTYSIQSFETARSSQSPSRGRQGNYTNSMASSISSGSTSGTHRRYPSTIDESSGYSTNDDTPVLAQPATFQNFTQIKHNSPQLKLIENKLDHDDTLVDDAIIGTTNSGSSSSSGTAKTDSTGSNTNSASAAIKVVSHGKLNVTTYTAPTTASYSKLPPITTTVAITTTKSPKPSYSPSGTAPYSPYSTPQSPYTSNSAFSSPRSAGRKPPRSPEPESPSQSATSVAKDAESNENSPSMSQNVKDPHYSHANTTKKKFNSDTPSPPKLPRADPNKAFAANTPSPKLSKSIDFSTTGHGRAGTFFASSSNITRYMKLPSSASTEFFSDESQLKIIPLSSQTKPSVSTHTPVTKSTVAETASYPSLLPPAPLSKPALLHSNNNQSSPESPEQSSPKPMLAQTSSSPSQLYTSLLGAPDSAQESVDKEKKSKAKPKTQSSLPNKKPVMGSVPEDKRSNYTYNIRTPPPLPVDRMEQDVDSPTHSRSNSGLSFKSQKSMVKDTHSIGGRSSASTKRSNTVGDLSRVANGNASVSSLATFEKKKFSFKSLFKSKSKSHGLNDQSFNNSNASIASTQGSVNGSVNGSIVSSTTSRITNKDDVTSKPKKMSSKSFSTPNISGLTENMKRKKELNEKRGMGAFRIGKTNEDNVSTNGSVASSNVTTSSSSLLNVFRKNKSSDNLSKLTKKNEKKEKEEEQSSKKIKPNGKDSDSSKADLKSKERPVGSGLSPDPEEHFRRTFESSTDDTIKDKPIHPSNSINLIREVYDDDIALPEDDSRVDGFHDTETDFVDSDAYDEENLFTNPPQKLENSRFDDEMKLDIGNDDFGSPFEVDYRNVDKTSPPRQKAKHPYSPVNRESGNDTSEFRASKGIHTAKTNGEPKQGIKTIDIQDVQNTNEDTKVQLLGEVLFPKSLNAQEVESIVSLERSRSMKSIKSSNKRNSYVNYDGSDENVIHYNGPGATPNTSGITRSNSILKNSVSRRDLNHELLNNSIDANMAASRDHVDMNSTPQTPHVKGDSDKDDILPPQPSSLDPSLNLTPPSAGGEVETMISTPRSQSGFDSYGSSSNNYQSSGIKSYNTFDSTPDERSASSRTNNVQDSTQSIAGSSFIPSSEAHLVSSTSPKSPTENPYDFMEFTDFIDVDNISFSTSPRHLAQTSPRDVSLSPIRAPPSIRSEANRRIQDAGLGWSPGRSPPPTIQIEAPSITPPSSQDIAESNAKFRGSNTPSPIDTKRTNKVGDAKPITLIGSSNDNTPRSPESLDDENDEQDSEVDDDDASDAFSYTQERTLLETSPILESAFKVSNNNTPVLDQDGKSVFNNRPISMSFRGLGPSFKGKLSQHEIRSSESHQSFNLSFGEDNSSNNGVGGGFGSSSDEEEEEEEGKENQFNGAVSNNNYYNNSSHLYAGSQSETSSIKSNNVPFIKSAVKKFGSVSTTDNQGNKGELPPPPKTFSLNKIPSISDSSATSSPKSFSSMISRKWRKNSPTSAPHPQFNTSQISSPIMNTPRTPAVSQPSGVRFSSRIILYDTYNGEEYDRHPDTATCNQLTPLLAQQIKEELNTFKSQMDIHVESRCHTHFF